MEDADQSGGLHRTIFDSESHTVHSLEEKAIELDLLVSAGMSKQSPPEQHLSQHSHMSGNDCQPVNDHNYSLKKWPGEHSRLADF